MKCIAVFFSLLLFLSGSVALVCADQTGPFTATIADLQVSDVGNPTNTVFLNIDITDSPCSGTNQFNRFTIVNNAQLSTILAAVMANKEVRIWGSGTCNAIDSENITVVRIRP